MSTHCKKSKKYRHSSTFYRKVNEELQNLKNKSEEIIETDKTSENYCKSQNISKTDNNFADHGVFSTQACEHYFESPSENNCVQEMMGSGNADDVQHLSEFDFMNFASDSEEDEESNDEANFLRTNHEITFAEALRNWALKNKIAHSTLNDLMHLTNSHNIINVKLPKDSRTFLRTPPTINISKMGSGEFWYNGLGKSLKTMFKNLNKPQELNLKFNIDGIPIFRGSPNEFWPILCSVAEKPLLKPITVAIYCGQGKPPIDEFLKDFVEELNSLVDDGLIINNCKLSIKVSCFVCDTPARCFIKGELDFIKFQNLILKIKLASTYTSAYMHSYQNDSNL